MKLIVYIVYEGHRKYTEKNNKYSSIFKIILTQNKKVVRLGENSSFE